MNLFNFLKFKTIPVLTDKELEEEIKHTEECIEKIERFDFFFMMSWMYAGCPSFADKLRELKLEKSIRERKQNINTK